jgi:hypothetical protein
VDFLNQVLMLSFHSILTVCVENRLNNFQAAF